MIQLNTETLNHLLDRLESARSLFAAYESYVLAALIIFALLNCFFGYALRKLWSVLFGFAVGSACGLALGSYLNQEKNIVLGIMLALGLLCGLLAFALYRIGLFFLIIALSSFCLSRITSAKDLTTLVLIGLIALVLAFMAVPFEHTAVKVITAVCGSVTAVELGYTLLHQKHNTIMWMIMLLLAVCGMIFQLKPWKKTSSSKKRAPVSKNRPVREPSANRTRVSQNTTYDFRFVPEEPDEDDYEDLPDPEEYDDPIEDPTDNLFDTTVPFRHEKTYDPDLSDIRQQLSEEVQEFYHDSKK